MASNRPELKTLMACDLVGSTKIVEELGDERAAAVFHEHDTVARSLLAAHRGLEIDKTDGFLLLFELPIDAVNFSMGYGQALRGLSARLDTQLATRTGIHVGELYVRRNTPDDIARGAKPVEVEGLAKPMVARLMSLASPHQTLLTRGAYDVARRSAVSQGSGAHNLRWISHGPYKCAGVRDPVEVFEVGVPGQAPLRAPRDAPKMHRAGRSGFGVLVLPFLNLSGDPEVEYIADGITDEIIGDLSRLGSLRIISRTSAMQLKGTKKDVETLGRELDVHYILEGSIKRAGDNLRIVATLLDAATDQTVWSSKRSGTVEQWFDMEEWICARVIETLEIQLSEQQQQRLSKRPIPDARAYDFYIRARQQVFSFTPEAIAKAQEYLNKGLQIMGEDNIPLQAAVGYLHWQSFNIGASLDPGTLDKARACANKIIDLDPESPEAHRLLGLVGIHTGAGTLKVTQHLRRANAGDPTDTDTLFWLSLMYCFLGYCDLGYSLGQELVELDPLTPLHRILPGFALLLDGDLERAAPQLADADAANQHANPIVSIVLGQALIMSGKQDEGMEVFLTVERTAPETFFGSLARFYRLGLSGDREGALAGATEELLGPARTDMQWSWSIGQCYAIAGDFERALDWVRNAVQNGFYNHQFLFEKDPLLECLRDREGYAALVDMAKTQWEAIELER